MTAIEKIDQAFLQLSFSIKIMAYIELGKIPKNDLDRDVLIQLPKSNLLLKKDMFKTPGDIILAAQNSYVITLGFSVISLDAILDEGGITRSSAPEGIRDLRDLIYMVRCAFAHDMMHPRWEVRGPFARLMRISLPGGPVVVDTRNLNQLNFELDQIGGAKAYFEMKDEIKNLLTHSHPATARRHR